MYAAPKPVAHIDVPSRVNVARATQQGVLKLGGRGLDLGSGSEGYQSLLSVMQLGAESPALPACGPGVSGACAVNGTARGGDLRYAGAASADGVLGFGIATWANWANVGNNTIPFVDIDVNRDGEYDYEVFVTKPEDTDVLVAGTVDLNTGETVDIQGVNGGVFGDVDTNVFDTNVIVLPVTLAALGIDPDADAAPLDYRVSMAGFYPSPGPLVDAMPPVRFDPLNPGLRVEGTTSSLLFGAQGGTQLVVHRDAAALGGDGTGSLLVLNLHNASGRRAAVVPVREK